MAEDCRISTSTNGLGAEDDPLIERLRMDSRHYQYPTSPPPHRSERTRWRWSWGKGGRPLFGSYIWLLAVLLVQLSSLTPVCSLILDCDSVKSCICGKNDDGGWRIECPNDFRTQYPVELRIERVDADNYEEAKLIVQCNDVQGPSPWSYIKGMDLSPQQVHSKIVRLEVRYCPTVNDGWKLLLKDLNLTGSDIQRFSFITENREDSAKSIKIPANFFENMPNIEILNLRDNKLTSIPDLSSLKRLQSINLRNNDLTLVPPGIFTQNTQVTSVALTNNKISEISPDAFPSSVEHLELNSNQISFLNSSTFSKLKELKRLFLNNNPLDNINPDTFDGMPALETLLVFNSQMTQFPNFNDLKKLGSLTISNAIRFNYLPGKDVRGEDMTTTLAPNYLSENILVLKNLPSLENLSLPLNHFTSIPVLENLPKLTSIDIKRNEIVEIESGAFSGLPSLKILNLSRNRLKTLGTIKASSLMELDVSRNNLVRLQNDTFIFLNSLKKLNLATNQIIDVTHKTFEPLSYLEELDLSNNNVTFSSPSYAGANIRDDFFFGDLGNRSPLRSSLNLKKLKLSHNRIDKLAFSDWAQTFIKINDIDLSFNLIKRITANELNFISSNLTLNLENNQISTVDLRLSFLLEDNASSSKQTRVLLSGNPLQCDCLAYGLKTFSSESYDIRVKNLSCKGPPELEGKKLVEVTDKKLVCAMDPDNCPKPCTCQERTVDKTVLVDCSEKNLTSEEIPKLDSFKGFYARWTVDLDLSGNEITDFNNTSYIKQFLNKTKHINLSGNSLTSTLFLELVADYQTTTFSIADNPFPCDNCKGFQIPWRAFPTRISDLGNVTCRKALDYTGPDGNNFELLYVQENSKEFENFCAAPKFSVVLVLLLVIAVIFLSCLCIGLFVTIRYGWAIKAYLYSKGWDWCLFWEKDLDADEDDGNEKLYDAFVSYSHKDEEWVVDELVSRLEGNEGMKLCLHFRDWTPGDWIPDQIVKSVDKSRRTIVILSKNFVESVWSRLEFKAAHAQALKERSNRVILILLGEDLKESDVQDDDLKMYMRMNTFMKWNDPLFWYRLKYALPHKKPSNSPPTEDEQKQNGIINKMQQRERAIKLDKLRAKLEQTV